MKSSEQQSVLNQQVHIHPGNVQGRWNRQSSSQCSINKFTYILQMRKGDGIMESSEWQSVLHQQVHIPPGNCAREIKSSEWQSVLNQQIHVHTGNAQGRWNRQSGSQCSINTFTYILEMCKGDGVVRVAVSAQSTRSRTSWKCAREMESSGRQSVLNQQVHVHPEMCKGDGIIRIFVMHKY